MTDCRIASQAREYQIPTFSPIKPENYTLADEVEAYLAKGGVITKVKQGEVVQPIHQMTLRVAAGVARRENKSTFIYYCKHHRVSTSHDAKTARCLLCLDDVQKRNDAKLKGIVSKFCGGDV